MCVDKHKNQSKVTHIGPRPRNGNSDSRACAVVQTFAKNSIGYYTGIGTLLTGKAFAHCIDM